MSATVAPHASEAAANTHGTAAAAAGAGAARAGDTAAPTGTAGGDRARTPAAAAGAGTAADTAAPTGPTVASPAAVAGDARPRRLSAAASKRAFLLGAAVFVAAGVVVARSVDTDALRASATAMADRPVVVVLALGVFGLAFVLRAVAWRRVLPGLSFGQSLAAIHLAFGANHVLPLRLGEPLRIVSVVRRADLPLAEATSSTVALRAADILAVLALGALVGPTVVADLLGAWAWAVLGLVLTVGAAGVWWLRRSARTSRIDVRLPGPAVAGLTVAAWLAESVLTWQASHWAGLDLTYGQAVVVTAVAVGAQIAAIAPSGFGTYEAAAVAAYVALGYDGATGLAAALMVHALTTAYSLVVGAIAVFAPAPGLLGRFRLPATTTPATTTPAATTPSTSTPKAGSLGGKPPPRWSSTKNSGDGGTDRSIVLFLPAHDEEATVGRVVHRVPETVAGHPVRCLVIDDGSTDHTVDRAREAGAEVVSMGANQGLGAAVRRGFAEATALDAVASVFCDADGEYDPAELERLVTPILAGRADYVVGSRFAGGPRRMRPHRHVGNRVLTLAVSIVSRRRITDGQSGYRALSADATAAAEVIHDFNYAQVLTLDLLAKGYRYEEVPISYRFRTQGQSFIRLGTYVRNVVPAVYLELNHT